MTPATMIRAPRLAAASESAAYPSDQSEALHKVSEKVSHCCHATPDCLNDERTDVSDHECDSVGDSVEATILRSYTSKSVLAV